METEGGDASVGHARTPHRTPRCRRPWALGGLHMADEKEDEVVEEISIEVC